MAESRTPDRRRTPAAPVRVALLAALALATLAAFAGVLRNGWVTLDDGEYIVNNPHVATGWSWANATWFLHAAHGGNWHPLTSWSHLVDVSLFGLHPAAHHAVSVLLHALTAVLLVLVLHRATGAWWRSLIVGGLFALHPLRVESVAWASERKDVLSGLWFVLALGAYQRWADRPGAPRAAAVFACAALGLASKPMLVTLPLVLVLFDIWPLGRLAGVPAARPRPAGAATARPLAALVLEKWPLWLLAAAIAVVTFFVQRAAGAVSSDRELTLGQRLANAALAPWRYAAHEAWPRHLVPYYPMSAVAPVLGVFAAAGLAAVFVLLARGVRRAPAVAVGVAWFVVMLLPVIGVLQAGQQAYADRYTYLPGIGLLLALAWLPWPRPVGRALAWAALPVLLVLGVLTARQVTLWHDPLTLFTATVRGTGPNPVAHVALGDAEVNAGRFDDALADYREALRLSPHYTDPCRALGTLLLLRGRPGEALPYLQVLVASFPRDPGFATQFATALMRVGRLAAADSAYRRAATLDPAAGAPLDGLAMVQALRGDRAGALATSARAAELAPRDADVRMHAALLARDAGRPLAEVAGHLRAAMAARPAWAAPLNELAWLLATSPEATRADTTEALAAMARTATLVRDPDASTLDTRAAVLAFAGRFAAAESSQAAAITRAALDHDATSLPGMRERLRLYQAGKAYTAPPRAH